MTYSIPALLSDGYKTSHVFAMHPDITRMYGNFTNRKGAHSNLPDNSLGGVAFVGLQYFCLEFLIKQWEEGFFNRSIKDVGVSIKHYLDNYLGFDYDVSHFEKLHDLGYLPIEIKAVKEGTVVPYGVAPMTIKTTVEGFEWLALYLETLISTELWPMSTSMTTSMYYLKTTREFFEKAGLQGAEFMNHDFSMRGMFGSQAAAMSGFAHLAAGNVGTDTLPALAFAEHYYYADMRKELVGCSVKATEHSIATSFILTYAEQNDVSLFEAEVEYARKLLKENPTGILSYVADSFDFWKFVSEGLPLLKEEILTRDGTFVVRPDSGTPEDVLCGTGSKAIYLESNSFEDWEEDVMEHLGGAFCDELNTDPTNPFSSMTKDYLFNGNVYRVTYKPDLNRHDKTYYYVDNYGAMSEKFTWQILPKTPEQMGLVETLYSIFGGTVNEKGFIQLDSHIGAIYGDSITPKRQRTIYERLMAKGFAPFVVLGIGSYSYQMVTRDTHGSAIKCTAAYLTDGTVVDVCKDPKTDPSKKSAKGLLRLEVEGGKIVQYDQQTPEQEASGLLDIVFKDGQLLRTTSLKEIREEAAKCLDRVINVL